MQTTLYREVVDLRHLHPDWGDTEIEAELNVYEGSNYDDDPSEIEIISAKIVDGIILTDQKSLDIIEQAYFETHGELDAKPYPWKLSQWRHS